MTERTTADRRTESARVSDVVDLPDPDRYAISPDCTHEEFLAVVRVYARAVVRECNLSVTVNDLSWEVSTRARRRGGVLEYRDGRPETAKLAWKQFENRGWSATASTIRHELIHAHLVNEGAGGGHGPEFRQLAAKLDTTVHCERFADPKWWVECLDCECRIARYRRSKLVSDPDRYRCGSCGGVFRVIRNR